MLGVLVLVGIIVVILFFTGTDRAASQGAITAHHCLDKRRTGVRTRGSWWVAERNQNEPECKMLGR